MNHPILKHFFSFLLYVGAWAIMLVAYAFILLYFSPLTLVDVWLDSFFSHFLFGVFGLFIWYSVYYQRYTKEKWVSFIIHHFTGMVVVLSLWLAILYALFPMVLRPDYLDFFEHTIWLRLFVGVNYYILLLMYYHLVLVFLEVKERLVNEKQLLALVKDAELDTLKSQINPHFLFNTLNSINLLTIQSPLKAQAMIVLLSDYLRYSVAAVKTPMVSFIDELAQVKKYLSIEAIRFGDKLTSHFDVEGDVEGCSIPPMMLLPLYENAIKHGVCESVSPIHIHTKIRKEDTMVYIDITNNLEEDTFPKVGTGTGLKNCQERLRLIYGVSSLLHYAKTDQEFKVSLTIPLSYDSSITS